MGGSVRQEWDASGLACAGLQDWTDSSASDQVMICPLVVLIRGGCVMAVFLLIPWFLVQYMGDDEQEDEEAVQDA
jgi:hypothetical protein